MTVNVAEILKLDSLCNARLVAGAAGLCRSVRWVHVVDIPDPTSWVRSGQFLLTTGFAWPRDEETQRALMRSFAAQGIAGVGLAVPQFFEHFPHVASAEADRAGLPVLEIPWEIPFASITEGVQRAIIAEHYYVIEQSEVIHRALTKAAIESTSLRDIAEVLGNLINRAITIEDMEGKVLGTHSIVELEDSIRQLSLQRGRTPPKFTRHLEVSGHLHSIQSGTGPVRIPAIPELGARARVACPIRIKGELVGIVWVIEGEDPLHDVDLRAAEHAALAAALHVARQRELTTLEMRLRHSFLDALLSGNFEPSPQALERAAFMGFDSSGQYRVGVMALDEALPLGRTGFLRRDRLADRLRVCLEEVGAAPLLSFSANRILFLLPDSVNTERFERLWKRLQDGGTSLLLGRAYQGVPGIARSYAEASSLVPHVGAGQFATYETLLLPRVMGGDIDAQESFIELLLGPLQRAVGGTALTHTLMVLADSGFHQKRAAIALHIHINTLRYRLRRTCDITGLDLDDVEVQFQLQLARHLLSMSHNKDR